MTNFNVNGRVDGLGNRIEEIIIINLLCSKEKSSANYVWNNRSVWLNKIRKRIYDINFTVKNIKISEKPEPNIPFKTIPQIEAKVRANLSREDMLKSAKDISPSFKIHFENDIKPIGIHIRGTDRINNNNHPSFMKDEREFYSVLSKTIEMVNNKCPKYIFLCSDHSNTRKIFINNLNKKIMVIDPICDQNISAEYTDFFALTLCKEIIMCSKFSTFAITASLIANIPIISFYLNENLDNRFKEIFQYKLDASYNKDFYLENVSWFRHHLINRLKVKKDYLLAICLRIFNRILH